MKNNSGNIEIIPVSDHVRGFRHYEIARWKLHVITPTISQQRYEELIDNKVNVITLTDIFKDFIPRNKRFFQINGVQFEKNPSGIIRVSNGGEYKLYYALETNFFEAHFNYWEKRTDKPLYNGYKPDYMAVKDNVLHIFEIKNEEFGIAALQQITKYRDLFRSQPRLADHHINRMKKDEQREIQEEEPLATYM